MGRPLKPLIRRSNLTDPPTYWALTKYTVRKLGKVEVTDASEKWDVTDQVAPLIEQAAEDAIRRAAEAIQRVTEGAR